MDGVITLSKYNKDDIVNILDLMKSLGINNAVIMLLATVGNADKFRNECYLTYEEQKNVIIELTKLKKEKKLPINLTIIPVGEGKAAWELYLPLKENNTLEDLNLWIPKSQFNTMGTNSVGCTAGKDNFYVNAYGDVYGCSMMCSIEALKAGNLKKNNLNEIWNNSIAFKRLRNLTLDELEGKCLDCDILDICRGGCRACAYTSEGKINGSDNRCPLVNGGIKCEF